MRVLGGEVGRLVLKPPPSVSTLTFWKSVLENAITIQVLRRPMCTPEISPPHPAFDFVYLCFATVPRKRYGAAEPWAGRGDSRWSTWKLHRSCNASPSPRRGHGLGHVFFGERLGEGATESVASYLSKASPHRRAPPQQPAPQSHPLQPGRAIRAQQS